MTSVRLLDLLLAEELMGWYEVPHRIVNGKDFGEGPWHARMGDPVDPNPGANCFGPPSYSAKIAAAWLVVEKMRKDGWVCEMTQFLEFPYVRFEKHDGQQLRYGTSHERDSMAAAICQAAYNALEFEST